MKREIKKNQVAINDLDRRTGVMLEHMDAKFDILVEGLAILDRKLDRYHNDMSERISRLEAAAG